LDSNESLHEDDIKKTAKQHHIDPQAESCHSKRVKITEDNEIEIQKSSNAYDETDKHEKSQFIAESLKLREKKCINKIQDEKENISDELFKTPIEVAHQDHTPSTLTRRAFNQPLQSPSKVSQQDQEYYETISNLYNSKLKLNQPEARPLEALLNQNPFGVLLKSLVMQELFSNAFKSLLQSSKPVILQNLNSSLIKKSLMSPSAQPNPVKRNCEVTSSESAESDMLHQLGGGLSKQAETGRCRLLSAFSPNIKTRANSINESGNKLQSERGVPPMPGRGKAEKSQ